MQDKRFVKSFNAAVEGFVHVLRTERNMRAHFLIALLVITFGIYLNFNSQELIALCMTITFVLVSEMFNTAVEHIVDLVKSEIHPIARIIKDVSAGAVLISAINATVVGYMLFSQRVSFSLALAMMKLRQSPWHVTFISLILVAGITVLVKIFSRKGTPLRGGMPSGHAAVAFSTWTAISFLTNSSIIIILSFFMAFLIARQRVREGIHNIWEVLAGSLLGILVTALAFQLLYI